MHAKELKYATNCMNWGILNPHTHPNQQQHCQKNHQQSCPTKTKKALDMQFHWLCNCSVNQTRFTSSGNLVRPTWQPSSHASPTNATRISPYIPKSFEPLPNAPQRHTTVHTSYTAAKVELVPVWTSYQLMYELEFIHQYASIATHMICTWSNRKNIYNHVKVFLHDLSQSHDLMALLWKNIAVAKDKMVS